MEKLLLLSFHLFSKFKKRGRKSFLSKSCITSFLQKSKDKIHALPFKSRIQKTIFSLRKYKIILHNRFSRTVKLASHVLSLKLFLKGNQQSRLYKGIKTQYIGYRYICEPNSRHFKNT